MLNVTGDYLWISLVVSLRRGGRNSCEYFGSMQGLMPGCVCARAMARRWQRRFGSTPQRLEVRVTNLGSSRQEQESILKGGSLSIFSVSYNPSPTISYWTLGNRNTKRETESEIFCLNHRIAILCNITAILPCLTAKLCQKTLKHIFHRCRE